VGDNGNIVDILVGMGIVVMDIGLVGHSVVLVEEDNENIVEDTPVGMVEEGLAGVGGRFGQ
jgi:hypothetical protein